MNKKKGSSWNRRKFNWRLLKLFNSNGTSVWTGSFRYMVQIYTRILSRGWRAYRSQSFDGAIRDTFPSGPGDTISRACERSKTAIHTRINVERTAQYGEAFNALEKRVEELLPEKFQTFSGEVKQHGTLSKDVQTLREDVILEEHSTWWHLKTGTEAGQDTNAKKKTSSAGKEHPSKTAETVIMIDGIEYTETFCGKKLSTNGIDTLSVS